MQPLILTAASTCDEQHCCDLSLWICCEQNPQPNRESVVFDSPKSVIKTSKIWVLPNPFWTRALGCYEPTRTRTTQTMNSCALASTNLWFLESADSSKTILERPFRWCTNQWFRPAFLFRSIDSWMGSPLFELESLSCALSFSQLMGDDSFFFHCPTGDTHLPGLPILSQLNRDCPIFFLPKWAASYGLTIDKKTAIVMKASQLMVLFWTELMG